MDRAHEQTRDKHEATADAFFTDATSDDAELVDDRERSSAEVAVHPVDGLRDDRYRVSPLEGFGSAMSRGAIAGLSAGLAMLVAAMYLAEAAGNSAVQPIVDASTVFLFQDEREGAVENLTIGLVTHLGLSIAFGVLFGLLVLLLKPMRKLVWLVLGGIAYGLLLYVANVQGLARAWFEWFVETDGPDQMVLALLHAGYGLLLAPFFIGWWGHRHYHHHHHHHHARHDARAREAGY